MGRKYRISFTAYALAAAGDFFEILAATSKPFRLLACRITQSTEAGDAQSEQLKFEFKRASGSFASGSGGSSFTPVALDSAVSLAAGATAEVKNTTQLAVGTGTLNTIMTINEHVANGLDYLPTPECQEWFRPAECLIIALGAAPTDSVTFDGYCIIEEE